MMIVRHFSFLRLLLLLSFLLTFISCIDSYEIDFIKQNKVLIVEGLLTTDPSNPDTIKIQYSKDNGRFVVIEPVASVIASVITFPSNKETKLNKVAEGRFVQPLDFAINPNEKYILRFTLPNNQQYESTPQQIIASPSISKIYENFNLKSSISDDGKQFLSANEVFVDFQDKSAEKNYYLWRYTHYEKIGYCATCNNEVFDYDSQSCIEKGFAYNFLSEPYYDYACYDGCYAIFKSKKVNIFSDLVSDGRLITGRLIAQIPYYSYNGCLVEIEQMCISAEAYNFFKILESQSQTTGGLADTPVAAIVGNIKNTQNSSEKIVGYFGIANIQKKRIWINRTNATGSLALVLGHIIITEPPTGPPFRPPLARCKPSATRTSIKPEGWQ